MAWRIGHHVVRGEIDNRRKDSVRGRIWLAGRTKPLILELTGNACKDLAGCLLKFRNSDEPIALQSTDNLYEVQKGNIGDLTASRKVREFDIPIEEAFAMIKEGKKPPEHLSNCLYLEWFSLGNGRVVIEATGFELDISDPEWQLTEEEERQRAQQAEEGFSGFMDKMNQALEQAKERVDYEKEDWDEFDYERFMQEADARTDKYIELLEKYGDADNHDEIIAREMGWFEEDETGETEDAFDEETDTWSDMPDTSELPDLKPDPATEGIDWINTPDGDIRHPLQHQCFEGARKLWREIKQQDPKVGKNELLTLKFEYQTTAVKLAGALNHLAYGRDGFEPAFATACLKRSLGHLHAAQKALAEVQEKELLPTEITNRLREEFFELRSGVLQLMDEFRGRS